MPPLTHQQILEKARKQEAQESYIQALQQPCPRCFKRDKLSRNGSNEHINNLRCERCQLRIASAPKGATFAQDPHDCF